ncbi:hypothetical protein CRUP_025005 [Coryphaenoides rupestris]|nr:hypothetical protein CRUP_025005 [Coryphaenoides rupestris]
MKTRVLELKGPGAAQTLPTHGGEAVDSGPAEVVRRMSDSSQSPDCTSSRPYDFSRAGVYGLPAMGPEGLGSAGSLQLQDPGLHLFNKASYNGIGQAAAAQTSFPFHHHVGGGAADYRTSDLQAGDFGQPKHWYPFAATDYVGQVPGMTPASQPVNLSPPIAETREQMKVPLLPDVKTEKDPEEEGYSTGMKAQHYATAGASAPCMPHGVYYPPAWNPSFWPGLAHITPHPARHNPSTSSSASPPSSLSPSPPSTGAPANAFFTSETSNQVVPGPAGPPPPQNPASARSSGSSSGGCSDSEEEENLTTEELEQFAKELKHKRITLGFTQADVGQALGNLYGKMFSQTTICRFEALQLSIKNMCKLKPLLQRWLNDAETSDNPQDRKRRTSLEGTMRAALESYFSKCPKPNTQDITHISTDLGLERDVVRVWFCNRRQKDKRVVDEESSGYSHIWTVVSFIQQVVRVWFCNRRQKDKRVALPLDEECEGQYYDQSPPPPPLGVVQSPLPGQGYPAYPAAPPPLYRPMHNVDSFKQALHPGLSPDCTSSRPYDFSRAGVYGLPAMGPEGLGSAGSLQLQDPGLHLFNKASYNGIGQAAAAQTSFPFHHHVGGGAADYRTSDLQAGDFGQPKHWYPFAATDYVGQVPGMTPVSQPVNLSPPIAETREQMKVPLLPDVKTEKDPEEEGYSTGMKAQHYATAGASAPCMPHGNPASARSSGSSSGGCSDSEEEENLTTEELEQFAKELKHKRITLGFTQADVGQALGNLYGKMFSQTTICRFEALQLSIKNMCKLKPLLQRWLNEAETSDNPQDMYKIKRVFVDTKKRKRRTSLEGTMRAALESYFNQCPKPNTQDITEISTDLGLEKDVVRVWFCNRRQRGKRVALPLDEECEGQYYDQSPPPPPLGMMPSPLGSQGYPAYPAAPPLLYRPMHNVDSFRQALHPGLVSHLMDGQPSPPPYD